MKIVPEKSGDSLRATHMVGSGSRTRGQVLCLQTPSVFSFFCVYLGFLVIVLLPYFLAALLINRAGYLYFDKLRHISKLVTSSPPSFLVPLHVPQPSHPATANLQFTSADDFVLSRIVKKK